MVTDSIEPARRDGRLPLSFAQQRLWFIDRFEAECLAYNMPFAVRLYGRVHVPVLERCFAEIVRRHEVLRTRFESDDGEPFQVISPEGPFHLTVVDVPGDSPAAREEAVVRLIRDESRRPFALARGPMLRVTLFRLAEKQSLLLLVMHHIASDGWSLEVVFRELTALYPGFLAGRKSPLPELSVQYADFAVWQRNRIDSRLCHQDLEYWRRKLHGAPRLLDLPLDFPRPAGRTYNGARESLQLPAKLTQALENLSRQQGTTLFMTLLAVFKVLLYRITHQHDVVVGTPIAGRNWLEIEDLIGFFVNTLVLRTDLSGEPTFQELLQRARATALDAFTHQEVPFDRLVEDVQQERSLSHSPLFQVMFAYQTEAALQLELPDVEVERLHLDPKTAKFDLTMVVTVEGGRSTIVLEYNTDLFRAATVGRMLGHYRVLLEAVAADPGRPISRLPLLTAPERQQMESEWNRPRMEFPVTECLHERFEAQAARTPDAVALTYLDQTLTYRELNLRADQVAGCLQARGAGPEMLIGLNIEPSIELIVGMLGILKSGAAYLPLDPEHPPARRHAVLSDAGVGLAVTQESLLDPIAAAGVDAVCLDRDWGHIAAHAAGSSGSSARPDHVAYVIYTSGSTGTPKGVLVEHRNAVRLFDATCAQFGFDGRDVWTLFHSSAFDFSVWEIFGALLSGGRLVIVPRATTRSPRSFYELLVRERVTVLNQTPTAFRQLDDVDRELREDSDRLRLRLIIFGGESLPLKMLERWIERHGDRAPRLVNMYGITETTVHVTLRPLTAADLAAPDHSPIGHPLPDLKTVLLDERGETVPLGVAGEIHVGGAGVARGYLNRPELTEQRFIPDPTSADSGARLYRTGDRARRLDNGELDYLGRTDQQVQIRGYRVEPGEIEAVLSAHPQVEQSAVTAGGESPGQTRLIAYVVTASREPLSVTQLRSWLKQQLPDPMVPGAFVFLDRIPMTPNGKVDRASLPEPAADRPLLDDPFVPPRSPLEQRLTEIFCAVLGIERVGIHDDFFELGGHSLVATRVMSRVRESFHVDLSLRCLFDSPTVAGLATALVRELAATMPPRELTELMRDLGSVPGR